MNTGKKLDSEKSINLNEPHWVIIVRYDYEIQACNVDHVTFLFHHYLSNETGVIEAAYKTYFLTLDTDIRSAIDSTNGFLK